MWGIIPVVALLVLIYFFEQRGIERDEAYRQVENLKLKIESYRQNSDRLSESKKLEERRALRDAFFLMCRMQDCVVPEDHTLQEIAEKFVDLSSKLGIYQISDIDYRLINSYFDFCIGRIKLSDIPKLKREIDRVEIRDGWQITTMKNGDVYQGLVPEEQAIFDAIEPHWMAACRFLDDFLEGKEWAAREIVDEYHDILFSIYKANKKALQHESSEELLAVELPRAIRTAIARGEWAAKTLEVRKVYERCIEIQIDLGITDESEYYSEIARFDALIKKAIMIERDIRT